MTDIRSGLFGLIALSDYQVPAKPQRVDSHISIGLGDSVVFHLETWSPEYRAENTLQSDNPTSYFINAYIFMTKTTFIRRFLPSICIIIWIYFVYFYASAFRRRGHFVFGLSVRPSVRSLKYPLLTCIWVHWSTRPTVTVLRHVCPSVRLSVCPSIRPSVRRGFRAFAGECMEGLAWNFTCWCILTIFRND